MSIFTKSDGTTANATSYSVGNVFKVIPEGTEVLCNVASVDEVDNDPRNKDFVKQGDSYLKIGLLVVEGEYKDVQLSQKIYINANDSVVIDRTVDLLSVYNNLSGGKLEKLTSNLKELSQLTDKLLSRCIVGIELSVTVGFIPGNDQIDKDTGNKIIDPETGKPKKWRDNNFVRSIGPVTPKIPVLEKIPEENENIISREPGEDDDFGDDEDVF